MLYVISFFIVCILWFECFMRPLFIYYDRRLSKSALRPKDILLTYKNGFKTDCKVAAYLAIFPWLIKWLQCYFTDLDISHLLIVYNVLIALAVSLVALADTVLYRFWQYKIEKSVLVYLRSPKGAFASVSASFLVACLLVWMVLAATLFVPLFLVTPLSNLLERIDMCPVVGYVLYTILYILVGGALFCIIRGLNIRPDTPTIAFFSDNQFLNHAAVNAVYNFIYSLSIPNDYGSQFQDYPKEKAFTTVRHLYPTAGDPQTQLLNTPRPNIMLIVWESLCSKFIGCLGGKTHVMPEFDKLVSEGVLFTQCYASSFRTDRALVSILSGLPGQPTDSIILHTSKLPHLPALPRLLRDECGYETKAVHGGDLTIFHKNDYYLASGHDRLIQQKDFPHNAPTGKWGVHDGYVFDWLANDVIRSSQSTKPFFTTFQTLSSHEPFDVPFDGIKDSVIDNSYAYVDAAFGRFVATLKASSAWKNLLIIITGDHGANLGEIKDYDDRAENTHIPLLLLGGSIRKPMKIDTLMSQTDIAGTLLGQMEIDHSRFLYSRDVLADTYVRPFAFHTFNNGFILRQPEGYTIYDNVAQAALCGEDANRILMGKLILQQLYSDIDKL